MKNLLLLLLAIPMLAAGQLRETTLNFKNDQFEITTRIIGDTIQLISRGDTFKINRADIYTLTGQSETDGRAVDAGLDGDVAGAYILWLKTNVDSTFQTLNKPNNNRLSTETGNKFGPEMTFADSLVSLGHNPYFIKVAPGGTGVVKTAATDWHPTSGAGEWWRSFEEFYLAFALQDLRDSGMFWQFKGHVISNFTRNAKDSTEATKVKDACEYFIDTLWQTTDTAHTVLIGTHTDGNPTTYPWISRINDSLKVIADNNPLVTYKNWKDFGNLLLDGIHPDADANKAAGNWLAHFFDSVNTRHEEYEVPTLTCTTSYPSVNPPIDDVTGAVAAYSVRLLRSAYTGKALKVRRDSDNAEKDIPFDVLGHLDVDTLIDFISGTTGFVKTWYDQSTNSRDITQTTTTKQPEIKVSGGGSNKPEIQLDGVDDQLNGSTQSDWKFLHDGDATIFSVWEVADANPDKLQYLMGTYNGGSNKKGLYLAHNDNSSASKNDVIAVAIANGSAYIASKGTANDYYSTQTYHQLTLVYDHGVAGDDLNLYRDAANNESAESTGTPSTSNPQYALRLGCLGNSTGFIKANMQEFIFYATQADRQVETNQKNYYGL